VSKELFRHINKNAISIPKRIKMKRTNDNKDDEEEKNLTTDNKSLSSSN
jgi:hypothetical protein